MNPRTLSLALLALLVTGTVLPTVQGAALVPPETPTVNSAEALEELLSSSSTAHDGPSAPVRVPLPDGTLLVSPYGKEGVRVAAEAANPAPAALDLPIAGAYADFVNGLVKARPVSLERMAALLDDYYGRLGLYTPGSAAAFEENGSVAYTYNVGDVDGDGYDDLLLDTYCSDPDPCLPRLAPITNVVAYYQGIQCTWPHKLQAISGRTGEPLWDRSLDRNHEQGAYAGCRNEYVVGVLPVPGELPRIVMFRWELDYVIIPGGPYMTIRNTIYLLSADGQQTWSKVFPGFYVEVGSLASLTIVASNLMVNPIIQLQPQVGLTVVPAALQPNLLLQGVGFNLSIAQTPLALPYATGYHFFHFSYQPDEWAMSVDPGSGRVLWRRDTYQPDERLPTGGGPNLPSHPGRPVPVSNRSVFPLALQTPPLPHTRCVYDSSILCPPFEQQWRIRIAADRAADWYWNQEPCCFDVTGDNIPDLVYMVYEWTATPTTNYDGPYNVDARIDVFDGATGSLAYSKYVKRNVQVGYPLPGDVGAYVLHLTAFDDVNGDGAADILVHEYLYQFDFFHNLTLVDGKTGAAIWTFSHRRDFQLLPIGDSNGDGRADLAFFDYTFDVSWYEDNVARANVTRTPIRILDGATGRELLRMDTFMAPNDIIFNFLLYRLNGVPDFNGDGAADIITDDPLFLPDGTTIHRMMVRSTRTGEPLYPVVSAGLYAFASVVGDATGDGVLDFFLINGDPQDLWGTLYDGRNGTAVYARRVMALRSSSYFSAAPLMRTHPMHHNGSVATDFLLNFQLNMVQVTQYSWGFRLVTQTTRPQLARFDGSAGSIPWAVPAFWDANFTLLLDGPSPASRDYANSVLFDVEKDRVPSEEIPFGIQVAVGVGSFGAAFGLSFLLAARRWKP